MFRLLAVGKTGGEAAAAAQAAWQRSGRQTEVAVVAWPRSAVAAARSVILAEQPFVSRAQLETAVLDLQDGQAVVVFPPAALHDGSRIRAAPRAQ